MNDLLTVFEKKLLHVVSVLNLLGLDTFNTEQAAHFMNRSVSKFKETAKTLAIPFYDCDGIKTFRKSDVISAREREREKQWQQLENGGNTHTFVGTKGTRQQGSSKNTALRSVR